MDYRSALEALRRPLEFVYRDSFANLESVKGLGESLKTAASQLSRHLAAPRHHGDLQRGCHGGHIARQFVE